MRIPEIGPNSTPKTSEPRVRTRRVRQHLHVQFQDGGRFERAGAAGSARD